MKMSEASFKETYPHLGMCVDGVVEWQYQRAVFELPETLVTQLPQLEKDASKLTTKEKMILTDGEDRDIERLVQRYRLAALNDFVASVFDGELRKVFSRY